ncbi:HAMP domain-containing histidine kinase [Paenibacillus sp. J5C_2022]|uniref:sensor histidine kinase n=1 Tax=Paenibacillus sp. J5C2022 TaxID=2977129 RepID=UPI0021D1A8B1|nr:HAMP domain-containing sensor histidine kinase [Paenibacillus sp. J5C2022]MCU6710520.1 HAMP domain-containing histidine kinase [Paenibacillus sp. J5C2022]
MFKKLKNRFLLLNMIMISVMMLVSFATVYAITYQNVQRDIDNELKRIQESYLKSRHPDIGRKEPHDIPPENLAPMPKALPVFFVLTTDQEWNLVEISSPFQLDDDVYSSALQAAADGNNERGQFGHDGVDWAYLVRPIPDGYMLVYRDATAQQKIVTNLIYTVVAVGVAMLVVIYFLSRFFASRSIAPVKEAFDKQKQFIADASHELKTPLTIIRTNTDVLLANREDTIANQAKWLNYIQLETERMGKLTSDLLYLTEMDDSRTAMMLSNFNMSEAAESILLTMEAVLFEKRIALQYDIAPGCMVYGNSEQIKQVILILLDNAVKYTSSGGSMAITLKKQHHDTVLSVMNTGEGIAPEHLHRIFDRFYRTDSSRSRQQGGYGLGLAIAKSIVEQHGGKLYARSAVGQSVTFYMHLP